MTVAEAIGHITILAATYPNGVFSPEKEVVEDKLYNLIGLVGCHGDSSDWTTVSALVPILRGLPVDTLYPGFDSTYHTFLCPIVGAKLDQLFP